MFSVTVVLRLRVDGKLKKRVTVYTFNKRADFEYCLWELSQTDSYHVNDRDATNVFLTVDNGL